MEVLRQLARMVLVLTRTCPSTKHPWIGRYYYEAGGSRQLSSSFLPHLASSITTQCSANPAGRSRQAGTNNTNTPHRKIPTRATSGETPEYLP